VKATASRILVVFAALALLAGCQSSEEKVSARSIDQARQNIEQVVDAFFAGAQFPLFEQPAKQYGCLGDLGSYHGPPFRWEYSKRAEYTAADARAAKAVVDEMAANGWAVKVRDRPQDEATNYALSDSSGVIISVTIPVRAETSPTAPPNTIRVTGTSECAS
jgi:hypothetical protein